MTEGERLAGIRQGLAAIAPGRWSLAHDGTAYVVMADSDMGGARIELCRLGPLASDAEREFLAGAPEAIGFLVGLVDRAAATVRALREAPPSGLPAISPKRGEIGSGDDGARPHGEHVEPRGGEPRGPDDPSWWHARPQKDYAAQAAMLCARKGFQKFLVERKGLREPASEDGAAARVRTLCGVVSRRDINGDQRAQKAWRALLGDYETWRRAG